GAEDHQPGGRAPFGPAEVEAMSRTVSPSSGKPYGLALVCRTWRAPRATVYRCRLPSRPEPAGRPGPVGPMSDTALLAAIRAVLAGSPFHGEGHRKDLGSVARRWRADLTTPGAAAYERERSARPIARRITARP